MSVYRLKHHGNFTHFRGTNKIASRDTGRRSLFLSDIKDPVRGGASIENRCKK